MSIPYQSLADITLPDADGAAAWGPWLAALAADHDLDSSAVTLLLHADDGVIWGRLGADGQLAISSEAYQQVAVPLRALTVQKLRLFGEAGELLLWRTAGGFAGRAVTGAADAAAEDGYYDENHLLWGEKTADPAGGFTLMRAGARELLHAPPGTGHAARLQIRHYIQYDETGQAYVALSRVLGLDWLPAPQGDESDGS